MDMDGLTERLGRVSHFKDLPSASVRKIIDSGWVQQFPTESILYREAEPSTGLFVLLAGQVQLAKLSLQGQVAIMAVFEPVVMFNEVPVLDGGLNPGTAIALQKVMVWRCKSDVFHELLHRFPQMSLGLLSVLASRNRLLVQQYEDLSFRSVLSRTAKLLLDLSHEGTQPISRRRNPNHQMAARIATGPEAFSRCLKIFKNNLAIECSLDIIHILNRAELRQVAQIGPVPIHD